MNKMIGKRLYQVLVASCMLSVEGWATSDIYNLNAAGNWNAAGSWSVGNIPGYASGVGASNSADIATFGNVALSANRTVTVDANRNIGSIVFSNDNRGATGFRYTLATGKILLSNGGQILQAGTGVATNGGTGDTISSHIVIIGDGGSASITANDANGMITITGGIEGMSTAGTTTLTLNGTSTRQVGTANSVIQTGLITDGANGGNLAVVKTGTGTWLLRGNHTYSGGFTLNQGRINTYADAGIFGTGTLTINGGTLGWFNATYVNYTNPIVMGGNFTLTQATSGIEEFSGTIDLGGATRTITLSTASGTWTNSGIIANGGFTKAGVGRMVLSGANTYDLGTTISAGSLVMGSATAIPNNSAVSVNGGSLDMNGYDLTVSSLSGTGGSITNNGSLTVNTSSSDANAGVIAGSGSLTKLGSGTQTLSGTSTYIGGTTINNGVLNLSGAGTLGSGNISIGSSGTLNMSGNALTLASTQMLTNRGTVGGGLVIGNGAFATGGGKYQTVTNALGGTLTPGTGGDTNFFSDLTLNGGSTNAFWLGSAATHDMSVVTNSLNYGGDNPLLKLDLTAWSSTPPETVVLFDNTFTGGGWNGTNQVFQLADWGAGANGAMLLTNGASFWAVGGSSATNLFTIRYDYDVGSSTFGSGNDIALMTVIPEPASLNLLTMLGAAYFMRRRIHRKRGRWNF